jgi:DNA invertase Pin-like site-specific DNA recombinase
MTTYGYARVSTQDQDTSIQTIALRSYGCDAVIREKASGAKSRPRLNALIARLKAGDTLVVHKLDRLARSMMHFVQVFEQLKQRGIAFVSLTEHIQTTTPQGRMFLHVLAAFAELERDMIRERCHAGILAARAAGKKWGAIPTIGLHDQKTIVWLWRKQGWEQTDIALALGLPVGTIRDSIYRFEKRGRYATVELHK